MREYRVEYHDAVDDDIDAIQKYIVNTFMSLLSGRRVVDRIFLAISSLRLAPMRGRLLGYDKLKRPIRLIPVKNYVIIFTVDEADHVVTVYFVCYVVAITAN